MIEAEVKRYIDQQIAQALNLITSGQTSKAAIHTEDIAALYPGLTTLTARPIMRPYGFVSRAPAGTISVTAQQGSHPGNKMTLGHRDKNAPSVDVGESRMYSLGGYNIVVKNGEIYLGKGEVLEHMVVGETIKEFLIALVTAIVSHTHTFMYLPGPGPTPVPGITLVPDNAAAFTQAQADYLDNDKILAKDGGRF